MEREPSFSISSILPYPHLTPGSNSEGASLTAWEALPGMQVSAKVGPGQEETSAPALRSRVSLISPQVFPGGGAGQSDRLLNQQSIFLYKFFQFVQSMPSSG